MTKKLNILFKNKKLLFLIIIFIILIIIFKYLTIEGFEDNNNDTIINYKVIVSSKTYNLKISYPSHLNEIDINKLEYELIESVNSSSVKLLKNGIEIKPRSENLIENEKGLTETINRIKGSNGLSFMLTE